MFVVYFIPLFLLTALALRSLRLFEAGRLKGSDAEIQALETSHRESSQKIEKINRELSSLNLALSKTVKMHEAARDICSALEEDTLVARFKEDLGKLLVFQECRLLPPEGYEPAEYAGSAVFALVAQETHLGYFLVKGAAVRDYPYLGILTGQFALGLKRARLYRRIQELAITDSLTGLYRRRYAMQRLREEFKRSALHHLKLSLLMIDVDYFKECNDKFGHLVGDIVLSEIGHRIKENIREVDMLSRFGGEEFMVFAPNTPKESAFAIAERIRRGVEASDVRAYDEKLKVSVSIGVASYPEDAGDEDQLIHRADGALYQAKKTGRNRVCTA